MKKTVKAEIKITTYGKGTKSEHEKPYIDTELGKMFLFHIGDNPFENKSIIPYIGKTVTLEGDADQYQMTVYKIII